MAEQHDHHVELYQIVQMITERVRNDPKFARYGFDPGVTARVILKLEFAKSRDREQREQRVTKH